MTAPPKVFETYDNYKTWFTRQYDAFVLPSDAVEFGPFIGPTTFAPDRPPWKLNWWIVFNDQNFIACSEYFEGIRKYPEAGQRTQFSYHYGVHPGRTDSRGCPKHSTDSGTFLRIDLAPDYADHIHFEGQNHIGQASLVGNLVILDSTIFDFITRVLEHRRTQKPLSECFEFEVQSHA